MTSLNYQVIMALAGSRWQKSSGSWQKQKLLQCKYFPRKEPKDVSFSDENRSVKWWKLYIRIQYIYLYERNYPKIRMSPY